MLDVIIVLSVIVLVFGAAVPIIGGTGIVAIALGDWLARTIRPRAGATEHAFLSLAVSTLALWTGVGWIVVHFLRRCDDGGLGCRPLTVDDLIIGLYREDNFTPYIAAIGVAILVQVALVYRVWRLSAAADRGKVDPLDFP